MLRKVTVFALVFSFSACAVTIDGSRLSTSELTALGTLATGLQGYWLLDGLLGSNVSTGAGQISDASVNGLNATAFNPGTPMSYVAGHRGQAIQFAGLDGQNIVVTDPPGGQLDFGTGSFSYGLWLSLDAGGTAAVFQIPFTKGGYAIANPGYDLEFQNTLGGQLHANVADGSSIVRVSYSATDLRDGQWHHVFVVADRSVNLLSLYVDGNVISTASIATLGSLSSAEDLILGGPTAWAEPMKGKMDEVTIHGRALSAAEVLALYQR